MSETEEKPRKATREAADHSYFLIETAAGPRVVHGLECPEGGIEIEEAVAREVSTGLRAAPAYQEAPNQPAAPAIDLTPILEQLKAHQEAIGATAQVVSEHAEKLASQGEKLDTVHEAVVDHLKTLNAGQGT